MRRKRETECVSAIDDIERRASELAESLAALPETARVGALNRAREILHEVSPFKDEPVDLVLWVPAEEVGANDYNPNVVAPPEMRLLAHSIEADGYTQPIVTHRRADDDEIVDGFHRHRCGKEIPQIRKRVKGHLPVARIKVERGERGDRIAATVRHNRARGEHRVDGMSELVRLLHVSGWKDEKIQAELGMQLDEVIRLKQITGLAALFADKEFSEAWEPVE